jgi:transposase InsO family protein
MPRIGTRKLHYLLAPKLKQLGVGRDRLFAILKANHLQIKSKKQYHITTNSHHRFRKHKYLLEGMVFNRPNQVWVTDITYIGTRKEPIYLALVTDVYSKKIMGYNVSNSLSTAGALQALEMALKTKRNKNNKLIHHSDRGLQYCSNEYQKVLTDHNIICSMTQSYDPYQNAIAERVNGILKQEFILGVKISDIQLMNLLIKESIYIYNNERPHLSSYMKTPTQMHQQCQVKIKNYKSKKYHLV